jgi:hypothetical protein
MKVAIMQPTYLPWSGYFALIHSVDLFVYLDNVQFEKRSWQQRNQIKTANGVQLLTVPVLSKGMMDQKINQTKLDLTSKFSDKHIKSITLNYKKAPFYNYVEEKLFNAMRTNTDSLVGLNLEIIHALNDLLGISTKTIKSSSINCIGRKADLLASICIEVGATEYISVNGSKNYLDNSKAFDAIDIPVKYFNFKHPKHKQLFDGFIENMSVIDILMNCGEKSLGLIKAESSISNKTIETDFNMK